MRVLHFSDVHVGIPLSSVPFRHWLNKRALGAANLVLRRRGRRFEKARLKLAALGQFARRSAVDLVIFSGDYTALGLEAEYAAARAAVEPLMHFRAGYFNVPGNHDLYVRDSVRGGYFSKHFGDTLRNDLPVRPTDGVWPLVRLAGEEVAVVGVESAHPNPPWRSSGRIPQPQLEALSEVLADPVVRRRWTFVVTHYAPRLADGGPDTPLHGLENADTFLRSCSALDRGAILCGHVHHPFHVRVPESPVPIFCAGSATMEGRESLWLFDVEPTVCTALPGRWKDDGYAIDESGAVEVWRESVDSRGSLQQA